MTARWLLFVLLACTAAGCGSHAVGSGGARSVSVPWRLGTAPHAGDRQFEVAYTFPGSVCEYHRQAVNVREGRDTVTIEVLARFRPFSGNCIEILAGGRSSVHLLSPLGRRRLVHAPTEPPL